jgi:hypothetical protein
LFYRARHIGGARLERHRLGDFKDIPRTYNDMRDVLTRLTA